MFDIDSINTKLENIPYLDVLFLTLGGPVLFIPIIRGLAPSPPQIEIRQCQDIAQMGEIIPSCLIYKGVPSAKLLGLEINAKLFKIFLWGNLA